MKKIFFAILFSIFISSIFPVRAQGDTQRYFKAKVKFLKQKSVASDGVSGYKVFDIEVRPSDRKSASDTLLLENVGMLDHISQKLKVGDEVVMVEDKSPDGTKSYSLVDFVRSDMLIILFLLFLVVVVVVAGKQGILSFLGMIASFAILMGFLVPQIVSGNNPIIISLLAVIMIAPISFYLSHGFHKKTTIALIGTFAALVATTLLAALFIFLTRLSGFASEEATFIQSFQGDASKIQALVLAGIIIAGLGILDDITVSQVSIVERLAKARPDYDFWKLYREAMVVGRDHIASLVNTLILVYAGAALPLFILFTNVKIGWMPALNNESIATEIVRTLTTSIGLVLSVPLTTYFASRYFFKPKN